MSAIKPVVVLPYDKGQFGGVIESPTEELISNDLTAAPAATATAAAAAKGEEGSFKASRNVGNRNDRQSRILKIVLNLAKNDAFNENLNIKNDDGSFNEQTNISKLLNISQKNSRFPKGMTEFIEQLHLAKVDPEYIINQEIKQRLLDMSKQKSPTNAGKKQQQDMRKFLVRKRKASPKSEENQSDENLKRTKNDVNQESLDDSLHIAKGTQEEGQEWEIPFDDEV